MDFNSDNYYTVSEQTPNFTTFKLNSNGLKVSVIPHASPTNTIHTQVVYKVGSANEKVGYTGSTHLLEHLMFKREGDAFKVLEQYGSTINATTSFNR